MIAQSKLKVAQSALAQDLNRQGIPVCQDAFNKGILPNIEPRWRKISVKHTVVTTRIVIRQCQGGSAIRTNQTMNNLVAL